MARGDGSRGAGHDHELGFAFSTDSRSHESEIRHAKSRTSFPQCGPAAATVTACRSDATADDA
jgi:hypothetical protein